MDPIPLAPPDAITEAVAETTTPTRLMARKRTVPAKPLLDRGISIVRAKAVYLVRIEAAGKEAAIDAAMEECST